MLIDSEIRNKMLKLNPSIFKNAFPKLYSWEELENLLNLTPYIAFDQRFSITAKSKPHQWAVSPWCTQQNAIPPSLLNEEILPNHHCHLIDSSRVNRIINQMCGELEETFNGVADAHIYFTVADDLSNEFGIHWDNPHNLIVQVEGESRFRIWNEKHDGQTKLNLGAPVFDIVLKCGDAAFIPSKNYHEVSSQTKRLSVSFPITCEFGLNYKSDRKWIKLF